MNLQSVSIFLLAVVALVTCEGEEEAVPAPACTEPSISAINTYTTKSVLISAKTVYIASFSVACKTGAGNMDLYALVNGEIVPAAKQLEADTYQVSWSAEHKKATTGDFPIKIFNEEGYLAYKKALRSGEDGSAVASTLETSLTHTGTVREGLFVQTEFVAVIGALLVWWLANTMRSQIME